MSEDGKSSMPKMSISVSGQYVNVSCPKGDVFFELEEHCDAEEVAQRLRDVVFGATGAYYVAGLSDGKREERDRIKGILGRWIEHEGCAVGDSLEEIGKLEEKIEALRSSNAERNRRIALIGLHIGNIEDEGGK